VTRKPCVLWRGGGERKRENFAAGMKGFSSWSRAGGMFSRHDKGGKYFI
jgi:hypothetical protein